jgi:gluconolactonase
VRVCSYRFDVLADGSFANRRTFAYNPTNIPDGVHTDSKGNVYAGVGDGVHVWNPSGKLIGKIYIGRTAANFMFMGGSRMIILGGTQLYYVTIKAQGHYVDEYL